MKTIEVMNPKSGKLALRSPIFLMFVLCWMSVMIFLAASGFFIAPKNQMPLAMPLAVPIVPVLFLILLSVSERVQAWADEVDILTATSLQSWRVIGGTFVFLWGMGHLPAGFAFFAGFGDIAVGILAAFVTVKIANKTKGWEKSARTVIYAGMLDFTVAITTGLTSALGYLKLYPTEVTASKTMEYPLVLFPVFIVPLFMIFHILAWRQLKKLKN